MRPREIQARIRSGDTVDQVAANAGISAQRVERFAYPVLLERSRTAELAQHAHPVREDGPDVQTLGEVVSHTFTVRGQDYTQAEWDSWRGDDGKWVVCLRWKAGRSDNRAHWVFSPGAHGGTVLSLDEHAEELLDPQGHRTPRSLRPVGEEQDGPDAEQTTLDAVWAATRDEPADGERPDEKRREVAKVIEAPIPAPNDDDTRELPKVPAEAPAEDRPATRAKGKKNHPVVPAWEDVLLGVRSQRG